MPFIGTTGFELLNSVRVMKINSLSYFRETNDISRLYLAISCRYIYIYNEISNFSSLICCVITLFFIQGFQNATFGVKNTALAQKLDKIAIFTYIHREPPSSNLLFGKTQKFCRNRLDQAGISTIPNSLIQTESNAVGFR